MRKEQIKIGFSDIKFNDANADCGGFSISWKCPKCKTMVVWAPSMWWKLECEYKCYDWDFDMVAIGSIQLDKKKAATEKELEKRRQWVLNY